jgi:hypothetical protein
MLLPQPGAVGAACQHLHDSNPRPTWSDADAGRTGYPGSTSGTPSNAGCFANPNGFGEANLHSRRSAANCTHLYTNRYNHAYALPYIDTHARTQPDLRLAAR